jgi:hypothetical protein
MKRKTKPFGFVQLVEPIGGADVRLFFSDGTVIERTLLGVKVVRNPRVVDEGLGIDPGDGGGEISAWALYQGRKGRIAVYHLTDTDGKGSTSP